jgi:hypothetical protein
MTPEEVKPAAIDRRIRRRWRRRAIWSGVLLVVLFMMNAADRTTVFPHWRVAAVRWSDATGVGHWDARLLEHPSDETPLAEGEVPVFMGRHSEDRILGFLKWNTFVWTYGANAVAAEPPDLKALLLPLTIDAPQDGLHAADLAAGLRERLLYSWVERLNWPHAMFMVLSLPLLALCFHATRLGFGAAASGARQAAARDA